MKEISCGAVLYTIENDEYRFLIVKDRNGNYGFPKGHIESGESYLDAAYREIKEEVGISPIIDKDFNGITVSYSLPNGNEKECIYFEGSFIQNQKFSCVNDEIQEYLLLDYPSAYEKITFDNAKDVLLKVNSNLIIKYLGGFHNRTIGTTEINFDIIEYKYQPYIPLKKEDEKAVIEYISEYKESKLYPIILKKAKLLYWSYHSLNVLDQEHCEDHKYLGYLNFRLSLVIADFLDRMDRTKI